MINPVGVATAQALTGFAAPIFSFYANLFGLPKLEKLASFDANIFSPLTPPSPDAILQACQRGMLTPDQAHMGLLLAGIPFGRRFGDFYEDKIADLWRGVARLNIPFYDVSTAFEMYNKGIIDEATLNDIRKRTGETEVSFKPLLKHQKETYSLQTTLELLNRGEIQEATAKEKIKLFGGYDTEEIDNIIKLRKIIPPISDIVRFSIREVFNRSLAEKEGFLEELSENKGFLYWAEKLGLGKMEQDLPGEGRSEINWPEAYWIAHWQMPSPTQAYEMLHRLRPGRIDRFKKDFPDVKPVEIEDVRNLLKINDYPKPWRDRLAAISSATLTRVDIRRGYVNGSIDEKELRELYKDNGYIDDNVDVLLEIAKKDKEDAEKNKKKKKLGEQLAKAVTALTAAFEAGAIAEFDIRAGLNSLWEDNEKVDLAINNIKLKMKTAYVKEYSRSVKREYFHGFYDSFTAEAQLISAGIQPQVATQKVAMWARQLQYPQKIASTTTIIDWYKRGLIQEDDAARRLTNLGWSFEDILLYIEEAKMDLETARLRMEAAKAKTESSKAKASARAAKSEDAEAKAAAADRRRQYPIAQTKRWFMLGFISDEEARDLLRIHTEDENAINLIMRELYQKLEEKNGQN